MEQNNRIKKIKELNYTTNPVNLNRWVNPFLELSTNLAYNKILSNNLLNENTLEPVTPVDNINTNNATIQDNNNKLINLLPDSDNKNIIIDYNNNPKNIINQNNKLLVDKLLNNYFQSGRLKNTPESENLARHIMQEVYTTPDKRRNIEGFKISKSLSTEEHVVYIGNKGEKVLLGLRGSANVKDFLVDAQIGVKGLVGLPDILSGTLNNRYARDENIYNAIRAKYPKRKIIMSGHSLGNTLGMNLLKNHKNDKNIIFYGYNGWVHPDYNLDKRSYITRQEGDPISFATPRDKTIQLDLKEKIASGALGIKTLSSYIKRRTALINKEALDAQIIKNTAKRDFMLKAQDITLNQGNTFPLNEELATHFPEYTSLKSIIENTKGTSTDYSSVSRIPNVFIKTDQVENFNRQLEANYDSDTIDADFDFDELLNQIQFDNQLLDIEANPTLENITEQLHENEALPEDYLHNVYISKSPTGQVADIDNLTNVEDLVAPNNNGMLRPGSDIRITSSDQLATDGTFQLTPFEDIVEGTGNIDAEMALSTALSNNLLEAAAFEPLILEFSAMLAMGLAIDGAIAWWSHSARRFKLKHDLFKTKLKTKIHTSL